GAGAGAVGGGVGEDARGAVLGGGAADVGVVGVQDVDGGVVGEVGVQGHAEQAAVPVVVDVGAEVGEEGGGGVAEVVEDPDQPALFGDEGPAVRGEADHGGVGEAGEDGGLEEPTGGGERPDA